MTDKVLTSLLYRTTLAILDENTAHHRGTVFTHCGFLSFLKVSIMIEMQRHNKSVAELG